MFIWRAIDKAICVRKKGPKASCDIYGTLHIVIFGIIEAFLSQFPSLEKVTVLSYIAAAMSFAYSLIGLCLCLLDFFSHPHFKGTLLGSQMGASNVSLAPKLWSSFQALGNIAFAYSFSMILIEIQVRYVNCIYFLVTSFSKKSCPHQNPFPKSWYLCRIH